MTEARCSASTQHETGWFLRQCQAAFDDAIIDDAVLLISELVTNAHNAMVAYDATVGQAPGKAIDFSLRLFEDHLLVEVIDSSPAVPALKATDGCTESGRGLSIVQSLSDDWGYFWHHGRKVVYAILLVELGAREFLT